MSSNAESLWNKPGNRVFEVSSFANQSVDGIGALISKIQREEFQIPITLEQQPDLRDIPGFYQRGAGNFWVATIEDRVIGTIGLLDIGDRCGALRKMFVDQEFRGAKHGVAQGLLDELVTWSMQHGIERVYLGTTSAFLAAHRFYEKNDFSRISKGELPPPFPIMAVDSLFFVRELAVKDRVGL